MCCFSPHNRRLLRNYKMQKLKCSAAWYVDDAHIFLSEQINSKYVFIIILKNPLAKISGSQPSCLLCVACPMCAAEL